MKTTAERAGGHENVEQPRRLKVDNTIAWPSKELELRMDGIPQKSRKIKNDSVQVKGATNYIM